MDTSFFASCHAATLLLAFSLLFPKLIINVSLHLWHFFGRRVDLVRIWRKKCPWTIWVESTHTATWQQSPLKAICANQLNLGRPNRHSFIDHHQVSPHPAMPLPSFPSKAHNRIAPVDTQYKRRTPTKISRQGMQAMVDHLQTSTPRPKSPAMNNEEPIELAHYPNAKKPSGEDVPCIERDDFPAPPVKHLWMYLEKINILFFSFHIPIHRGGSFTVLATNLMK